MGALLDTPSLKMTSRRVQLPCLTLYIIHARFGFGLYISSSLCLLLGHRSLTRQWSLVSPRIAAPHIAEPCGPPHLRGGGMLRLHCGMRALRAPLQGHALCMKGSQTHLVPAAAAHAADPCCRAGLCTLNPRRHRDFPASISRVQQTLRTVYIASLIGCIQVVI